MTEAGATVRLIDADLPAPAPQENGNDDLTQLSKLANIELARADVKARAEPGYLLVSSDDFAGASGNVLLAPAVDAVIFLARVGKTSHQALRDAQAIVVATGATLAGTICVTKDSLMPGPFTDLHLHLLPALDDSPL